MIIPALKKYILEAIKSFDTIPVDRKKILQQISTYVAAKDKEGKTANLVYVCTHNSRRSHMGQIWGKTAAAYYQVGNVNTFSAGTEATAFNPNAIKAIEDAGFQVIKDTEERNPRYNIWYSVHEKPLTCFSKTYEDESIPDENLCAIMTCTEADGNCPFIPGTELRIACPYVDPKAFDSTPQQDEKYAERCLQIARENLYLFSLVSNATLTPVSSAR